MQMVKKRKERTPISFAIREIQIKSAVRAPFRPTRVAGIKRHVITSVGDNVERLAHSYIAGGNAKRETVVSILKSETIGFDNSTPKCLPKRNIIISSQEEIFT